VKVSLIQSNIIWQNKLSNLINIERLINENISSTDLIILPEMFNTGFTMNPEKYFSTMKSNDVSWMKKIAYEKDCAVAGSLIIKENNRYYNRLVFIDKKNSIHFYDKRHLFRMAHEHSKYTSGKKHLLTEHYSWKIMWQVCYDLRFPVWSRNTSNYDLLIYVANWPEKRIKAWDVLLRARAIENQCYVIGVNRVGFDGNKVPYNGHSVIISPTGEILAQLPEDTEGVINFRLNLDKRLEFSKNFPVSLDRDNFSIDF